jgi:hypothetical protein
MPAIIPNRSQVEGKIVSISKSKSIDHFSVMELRLSKISDAGSKPGLVKASAGENLHIHIADDVQQEHGLKEGSTISAQVRQAPDNLFVIPDSVKVL